MLCKVMQNLWALFGIKYESFNDSARTITILVFGCLNRLMDWVLRVKDSRKLWLRLLEGVYPFLPSLRNLLLLLPLDSFAPFSLARLPEFSDRFFAVPLVPRILIFPEGLKLRRAISILILKCGLGDCLNFSAARLGTVPA